ncbi:hypothetical protein C1H76_7531 [Elsinoe australis]|uniref:Uncharacterized protein n=1 Tax=Elsinoe australis TaxID=40998 RepID=A0A4U7AQ27_9PEZI|nr:hypothetical protein C1H76_7531 [Elsinoe australis]
MDSDSDTDVLTFDLLREDAYSALRYLEQLPRSQQIHVARTLLEEAESQYLRRFEDDQAIRHLVESCQRLGIWSHLEDGHSTVKFSAVASSVNPSIVEPSGMRGKLMKKIHDCHTWEAFPQSLPTYMRTTSTGRSCFGLHLLQRWWMIAKHLSLVQAVSWLSTFAKRQRVMEKHLIALQRHLVHNTRCPPTSAVTAHQSGLRSSSRRSSGSQAAMTSFKGTHTRSRPILPSEESSHPHPTRSSTPLVPSIPSEPSSARNELPACTIFSPREREHELIAQTYHTPQYHPSWSEVHGGHRDLPVITTSSQQPDIHGLSENRFLHSYMSPSGTASTDFYDFDETSRSNLFFAPNGTDHLGERMSMDLGDPGFWDSFAPTMNSRKDNASLDDRVEQSRPSTAGRLGPDETERPSVDELLARLVDLSTQLIVTRQVERQAACSQTQ